MSSRSDARRAGPRVRLPPADRGEALLAESPLPTVLLAREGNIVFWNRAAENLFGWRASELLGRPAMAIARPEGHDAVTDEAGRDDAPIGRDDVTAAAADLVRRVAAGETLDGVEARWPRKDGGEVEVAIYAGALSERLGGGRAIRFVDLSERRRLEAAGREEATRRRLLAEFLDAATRATDARAVTDQLAARSADALGAACMIFDATDDGRFLEVIGLAGRTPDEARVLREMFAAQRWRVGEGMAGAAFESGEPIFHAWFSPGERAAYLVALPPDRRAAMASLDMRAVIAVPLVVDGERVGALTLARFGPDARPFGEADRDFAIDLAHRADVALARLELLAARERDARTLQTMFDASPLPTYLLAPDGTVERWNRAAERLFGFTAAEVVGRFPPTISERERDVSQDVFSRVQRGEIVDGVPARRLRGDGSEVEVLLYGAPIRGDAGETRLLGIYADMTERNRLERQLRETTQTLSAILDASPLAVIAVDERMRVTYWSRAAESLYGWRADEVLGEPPPTAPSDDPGLLEATFARVRRGENIVGESRRATKDGRPIDVLVHVAALRDSAGNLLGAIGVHEDVTERRRLEAELLQAQKMETVGRLAGGVAHDFNNILTAIIGYSDLARATTMQAELHAALDTIRASAERAAGLTQQLLAFSRRQMLQPRVVEANDVLTGIGDILRRLIGEDIDLLMAPDPDAGSLRVDRTQLEQVLLNLAVNARDAMPAGGRLVMGTGRAWIDGDQFHIEMPPGDYVVISVTDTGVGMDEETRAHIFEPFFTTKPVGKGTGLGLSTAYGIVRQSGGYIWTYSEPGRGTTFKLYFPRSGADGTPASRPEPPRPAGRGRVLLVEDDPTLRELARVVLMRGGFEVHEAAAPTEAIALAGELGDAALDLLVTDVVMPGLTGVDLAHRLREARPGLRVLFMSGYAEDVVHIGGAVSSRFLAKPFTPDSLLRAVDETLAAPSEPV